MEALKKIIALLIVLLPVSVYYKAPFIFNNLTIMLYLLIVIISILSYITSKAILYTTYLKEYSILMLWVVIISFYTYLNESYANISNMNMLLATFIVYFIFIMMNSSILKSSTIIKYYTIAAYFSLGFLLLQIILFVVFKFPLSGKIPFLELLSEGYDGQFNNLLYFGNRYSLVWYSSIFAEPSHLALFSVPLLCIKLFDDRSKNLYFAVIITAVIFLSTSGNGIVITSIIWLYYFYSRTNKISVRKVANIILGLAILYFIHLILSNFVFYSSVVNRLFFSTENVAKADYRIYRGFDYLWQLPLKYKIFGIGYKNLTGFASYNNLFSQFDASRVVNREYLNAISQILIYFGIVGFIPFYMFIKKIFKNNNTCVKALVISFGLMSISSSVLFDTYWVLYLAIIFSFIYSKDKPQTEISYEQ